jgi:hypothetical protein
MKLTSREIVLYKWLMNNGHDKLLVTALTDLKTLPDGWTLNDTVDTLAPGVYTKFKSQSTEVTQ